VELSGPGFSASAVDVPDAPVPDGRTVRSTADIPRSGWAAPPRSRGSRPVRRATV